MTKQSNKEQSNNIQISPSSLKQKIDNCEDIFILDVRTKMEHESWRMSFNGYRDSLLAPIDTLSSPHALEKIPKDKQVVTLCSHGIRSFMAAKYLSQLGYNVRSLEGGLTAWNNVYDIAFIPILGSLSSIINIWQVRRVSKGCMGYLVASKIDKDAIVIDPTCDMNGPIQKIVEDNNLHITKIFETHVHADHISGASKLALTYGAKVYVSSLEGYEVNGNNENNQVVNEINNESKIHLFDSVSLKVIHTPGHTNGSLCFELEIEDNVREDRKYDKDGKISDGKIDRSAYLFTGDTLFTNGIGRPDLHNKVEQSANNLYNTYQEKILRLPKYTVILPCHFNSSFEHEKPVYDTLDSIINNVSLLSKEKEEFLRSVINAIPSQQPANYKKIIEINKKMIPCDNFKHSDLEAGPNACGINN
jgi:glyoxylase-like metal-dependent hydrolase (beta-lactamase superfamily II)/rhodanese-related sulfurtransferase